MVQIAMDGPSTNWKYLEALTKDRRESDPDMPGLIKVVLCGLHVVHGAYKYGSTATGWNLDSFLDPCSGYLKTLAKRENYTTKTGSKTFPIRV